MSHERALSDGAVPQPQGNRTSRTARLPKSKLQPSLTPMIDVTFQLLLYFLLTATFLPDEGQIPGCLPGTTVTPRDPEILRPLEIAVTCDAVTGKAGFIVDRKSIATPKQLQAQLVIAKTTYSAKSPVRIKAAWQVRWQDVTEAYNAAVKAGFETVGLVE